jgi:hypothetical protein
LATARVIKPFGSDKKDGGGWWWWGLAGLADAILEVGYALVLHLNLKPNS